MRSRKLCLGRCGSCNFEHRQMTDGWGLTALFVRLGSRSWSVETNRRSALLGEKLESWSLLLAAVPGRASIRGLPKESGQRNRATTTKPILGLPFFVCSFIAPEPIAFAARSFQQLIFIGF